MLLKILYGCWVQKKKVVVVSSGAISLGRGKLNLKHDLTLNESQAVAARGQIELMTAWKNEFKKYKKQVAQILLSPSDIKNKKSSKMRWLHWKIY